MKKRKSLVASLIAIVICFSMLLGTTYAWFTDSIVNTNNIIKSGNLNVELLHTNAKVEDEIVKEDTKLFVNANGGDILWEPGASVTETFVVKNVGSLALKFKFSVKSLAKTLNARGNSLEDVLKLTVKEQPAKFGEEFTGTLALGKDFEYVVSIAWNNTTEFDDNEYQNLNLRLGIELVATQVTAEYDGEDDQYDIDAGFPEITYPDFWNGEDVDTSWCDPTKDEYEINSAAAFAGLSAIINGDVEIDMPSTYSSNVEMPEEFDVTFDGKTIILNSDVDLSGKNFEPIGGVDKGVAFQGTFDGNNHTISGLYQSGWDLGYKYGQTAGMGLFGWIGDATIKNLNIDNAEISMEAVVMGVVAGYAAGNCTFENITITNTQIANYNWDTGGIVGQLYGTDSTFIFKNIKIDESNTISGHWGTWDVSAGGVIGRTADGVKVIMEDIEVACVLDVYNDAVSAYQWFAYRYSGMLVGYTKTTKTVDGRTEATAPHVTCKNVTVIYNDWANYTYCQFGNVAPQYVREQGGYSTDPYYSGRHWTAALDSDGNKVVDTNHKHAEGEAHRELLVFDQLFGGGQGVYGNPSHEGVTVIYNNK